MSDSMTLDDYHALNERPARSKYGNTRAQSFDGRWFDSKAERNRYEALRDMERRGEIRDLECQPPFELQSAYTTWEGRKIQAIRYKADFAYSEPGNPRRIIEDVKGHRTGVFNIKWKIVQFKYPENEYRLEMVR
ncbi:MAG: DUF1064 domain-containing protein [Planctomycetota bacterium]|jgi:hypothetical protein